MKSKRNKKKLANVLSTFNVGCNVTMDLFNDSAFDHDEADVTMVSYVLDATRHGKSIVQIVSDDTDVFLLLVYWVYKASIQAKIRMERWDGMILDINATCANLGPKCLQLLGMHALSGCDNTSYPYGKGKIRALNSLLSEEFPILADIGEVSMTKEDLLQAALPFFRTLYQQPPETSMESARFNLFAKKKNTPKIMALPPTSDNLSYHVLRAHLQVMLWKAADQLAPPSESTDITNFGWEIHEGIPVPKLSQNDPVPPNLMDVIQCKCKAKGNKCSSLACGCQKEQLSCTTYCNCLADDSCCNPYTIKDRNEDEMQSIVDVDFESIDEDNELDIEHVENDN